MKHSFIFRASGTCPEVGSNPTSAVGGLQDEATRSQAAPRPKIFISICLGRNPSQDSCWGGQVEGEDVAGWKPKSFQRWLWGT